VLDVTDTAKERLLMKKERKKTSSLAIARRRREAQAVYDYCMKNKVSLHDSIKVGGMDDSCFYNTLRDYRKGLIADSGKKEASEIIDMLLRLNQEFSRQAKYLTWEDVHQGSEQMPVSVDLPLFQKQVNKNLVLVQQLTGKTEQEITKEAIAMYCKAILQDYVSTL